MSHTTDQRHIDELQDSYLHLHKIVRNEEETTYVFRWTIRDYACLAFGVQYYAHHIRVGKTLHRLRIAKHYIKIRTHPDHKKLTYVHLGLTPFLEDAQFSMTILRCDNEEIQPSPCNGYYYPHLINRECYSSFVEPTDIVSCNYNPTVICRITTQREDVEVYIEKSNLITTDLKNLFLDGKFSDITIQVGNTEFRAHSAILAARSPVFDAMLRHEMKEKAERTLEILDFEAESFRELLWYLYTGRTNPLSVDIALPLLQLSDKYDVQELKSDLEDYLRSNISIARVLDILVAADICNAESLKAQAVEFVLYNLGKVMRRKEWKTFRSRLNLVDEIMSLFGEIYETDF